MANLLIITIVIWLNGHIKIIFVTLSFRYYKLTSYIKCNSHNGHAKNICNDNSLDNRWNRNSGSQHSTTGLSGIDNELGEIDEKNTSNYWSLDNRWNRNSNCRHAVSSSCIVSELTTSLFFRLEFFIRI
jgi:hypothetical protein